MKSSKKLRIAATPSKLVASLTKSTQTLTFCVNPRKVRFVSQDSEATGSRVAGPSEATGCEGREGAGTDEPVRLSGATDATRASGRMAIPAFGPPSGSALASARALARAVVPGGTHTFGRRLGSR